MIIVGDFADIMAKISESGVSGREKNLSDLLKNNIFRLTFIIKILEIIASSGNFVNIFCVLYENIMGGYFFIMKVLCANF